MAVIRFFLLALAWYPVKELVQPITAIIEPKGDG
jgi:hypothetical protein